MARAAAAAHAGAPAVLVEEIGESPSQRDEEPSPSGSSGGLACGSAFFEGGEADLEHERARVTARLRLRPRVLTASAKSGRHVSRLLTEVIALGDRLSGRIPTPELNRFLAEIVQLRQPPVGTRRGSRQHRLKLIYMTQIGERPPRFAVQVNSKTRVTRDYAYFLENRLRARYGMEGIPLIIDFVERGNRSRRAA